MEKLSNENTLKLLSDALNKATVKGGFTVKEVYEVYLQYQYVYTAVMSATYSVYNVDGVTYDFSQVLSTLLVYLNQGTLRGTFNIDENYSIKTSYDYLLSGYKDFIKKK